MARRFLNQKGFTITEALVVVGLVGFLGVVTMQIDPGVSKKSKDLQKSFDCENHLTSSMAVIRSIDVTRSILQFNAHGSNRYPTSSAQSGIQPTARFDQILATMPAGETPVPLAGSSALWPNSSNSILGTGTAPVLRSPLLIEGSLRALMAIYNNSGTSICSTFQQVAAVTSIGAATSRMISSSDPSNTITTEVRIIPYNLTTGVESCIQPIFLRPLGMAGTASGFNFTATPGPTRMTATNVDALAVVTAPSDIRTDLGLRVYIQARDTKGTSCNRSYNFAYSNDSVAPAAPEFVRLTRYDDHLGNSKTTLTQPASNTPQAGTQVTMEVGYSATNPDPGSQLLCRDVSKRLSETYLCFRQGSRNPGPQKSAGSTNLALYTTGSMTAAASPAAPGYRFSLTTAQAAWVPCESVTVCGVSPQSSAVFVPGTGAAGRFGIRNRYIDLPASCRIHVQAIAVDVAGNESPVQNIQVSGTVRTLETTRPSCGSWCARDPSTWPANWRTGFTTYTPADGTAAITTSANGYWQTNGCCVGTGCTPHQGATVSTAL